GSRFTRPRPFRVNAGAAHSYTLLADGTTRYLSELVAGDAVLVAEPSGTPRSVRVGRIKIERRPMVLIEVERGGRRYTAFLQEAETVRLSAETERIPTTHLTAGQRIFGAAFPPARHLGGVVEETIEER
ncbi:MAG: 3-dehydroquinate synthase II, partial [Thermoplasmata archaeon]|nr:3-dehydroquinate synthase II [Thermoplasmata archaeon]